jgi:hypothetical protein
MNRSAFRPVAVAALLTISVPAFAAEETDPMAPPTAAVAIAWAKEAKQRGPSPAAFRIAYGSYAALSTLDMISTVAARQRGAREMNPLMSGGYGRDAAMKAALAGATIAGVKAMERKGRKAAFVTMIAINAATAVVVANNCRNAGKLR